jgi:hypothetical protein
MGVAWMTGMLRKQPAEGSKQVEGSVESQAWRLWSPCAQPMQGSCRLSWGSLS